MGKWIEEKDKQFIWGGVEKEDKKIDIWDKTGLCILILVFCFWYYLMNSIDVEWRQSM